MNNTTDSVEPPFMEPKGSHDYLFVASFFFMIVLLFVIAYVSHLYKRSQSPPPPDNSFDTTSYEHSDRHLLGFSRGLDDDVLVTFPTFLYSETKITNKGDTTSDANGSGCSICLADYKPADVVRLLPECEHLFHVSCIDTWLKAHPTCPVCRNSPQSGNLASQLIE